MKVVQSIRMLSDGSLWLSSPASRAPKAICTVSEACRRLKRSRRQVYRQLRDGHLEDCGMLLGERLVGLKSLEMAVARPAAVQPLPARLAWLFPEYRLGDVNAGTHRDLVLSRILENGGIEEVRWMRGRYREADVVSFLEGAGARLLSPRAFRFWRLFHGLPVRKSGKAPTGRWRARSNPWNAR